ncbi:MAG: hypothetical protein SGCHY_004146, partial [Lobulomycetales sp.]
MGPHLTPQLRIKPSTPNVYGKPVYSIYTTDHTIHEKFNPFTATVAARAISATVASTQDMRESRANRDAEQISMQGRNFLDRDDFYLSKEEQKVEAHLFFERMKSITGPTGAIGSVSVYETG